MLQYIWLVLLLTVVALLGVGGALVLSLKAPSDAHHYQQEWVKALLQAGLIAVLGLVTSGVLERFQDTLQQRRDKSTLRLDVLTELSRAYMDVKRVRRKIQDTKTFTATETDLLNQQQVIFEMHMYNSGHLFRQDSDFAGYLKTMEGYLNTVANEPNSSERRNFDSGGFKAFSRAYGDAAKLMRVEIAGR